MFRAQSKDYSNNNAYHFRQCTSEKKLSVAMPDFVVGNYRYSQSDIIGKGFSSRVYKAYHKNKGNQIYAIKVIDTSKFRTSSLYMLETQVQIHKSLNHPNVVHCYESFKIDQFCYIITEYCENGDLMKFIREKRNIQEKKVIEILKQILNGAKYLLEQGILHRDLKPANIFRKGQTWKIGDFGFAIRQKYQLNDKINVGTPLYMPLEALTKNRYSPKSDIFALGVIAYETIFGKTPWQSASEKQLIKKLSKFKMQFAKDIQNQSLKDFMLRACQNDQIKRLSKSQFLAWNLKSEQNPNNSYHQTISTNYSKNNEFKNRLETIQKKIERGLLSKFDYLKNSQLKKKNIQSLNSTIKKHTFIPKCRNYDIQNVNSPKYRKKTQETQGQLIQYKSQSTTTAEDTPESLKLQHTTSLSKEYQLKANLSQPSQFTQPKTYVVETSNNNDENRLLLSKNKQILLQRLNFCKFLFNFIKNIHCLLLPAIPHRENLKMILFKHLLKNIKQIEDRKTNTLNLFNWEHFKNTEIYSKLIIEIKQYSIKYQREYLNYLKSVDVTTIRSVNKYFPELSQQIQKQDSKFYGLLEKYLKQLLKISNHETILLQLWDKVLVQASSKDVEYDCQILNNCANKLHQLTLISSIKTDIKHFEALKSLHTYFIFIKYCKQGKQYSSQALDLLHNKLPIPIQTQYQKSRLSISDITNLREQLKSLQ